MIEETSLLAALLMGLAGAGHCLAMCGGLASLFGQQARLPQLLAYNAGRVASYTIAGFIVGLASGILASWNNHLLVVLRVIAAIFMVGLGFYFMGKRSFITLIERFGRPLWHRLQPLALWVRNYAESGKFGGYWYAGMVWGWLPCGLVYNALAWAAVQPTPAQAALSMTFFGLGTLPVMLFVGQLSRMLTSVLQSQGFRSAMGILFILYGIWIVYTLLLPH